MTVYDLRDGMRLFRGLFGRGQKRALPEPGVSESSAEDRAAARKYWDAQTAADQLRRGVPSNGRRG